LGPHLPSFGLGKTGTKAKLSLAERVVGLRIGKYDEFLDEIKEREFIEICTTRVLFNSNIFRILKDKLDRRNIVAHPSNVLVVQSQANDVVTDLINNVVLALI
jgi:hypothetical protein